jgi:hypothetical protein
MLTYFVNRYNIRMTQLGCCLRFSLEPLTTIFVLTQVWRKELQGDLTIQFRILSQIHLTHPTGADFGDDFVMAHLFTLSQGHKRLGLILIMMVVGHRLVPALTDWYQ